MKRPMFARSFARCIAPFAALAVAGAMLAGGSAVAGAQANARPAPALRPVVVAQFGLGNLLGAGKDIAVKAALATFGKSVGSQLPIVVDSADAYPTVANLPGPPFAPVAVSANLAAALRSSRDGTVALPPGDYAFGVSVFCMRARSGSPDGHRYLVAPLHGSAADIVTALNSRIPSNPLDHHVLQVLSWNIQAGMAYGAMQPAQRSAVDRIIPDYRGRLNGDVYERIHDQYTNVAQNVPGMPSFEDALTRIGPVGAQVVALQSLRAELSQPPPTFEELARTLVPFVPAQAHTASDPHGETPWSRYSDRVFVRFITAGNYSTPGTYQVRVLPAAGSTVSRSDEDAPPLAAASAFIGSAPSAPSATSWPSSKQAVTPSAGMDLPDEAWTLPFGAWTSPSTALASPAEKAAPDAAALASTAYRPNVADARVADSRVGAVIAAGVPFTNVVNNPGTDAVQPLTQTPQGPVPAPPVAARPPPRPTDDAKITSETVATLPADRTRTTIGVGEQVQLTYSPGIPNWSIATPHDGVIQQDGAHALYTAASVEGQETIIAHGDHGTAMLTFTVIAPNGVNARVAFCTHMYHKHNTPTTGMVLYSYVTPDTVSFRYIDEREVNALAEATGVYAPLNGLGHLSSNDPNQRGTRTQVSAKVVPGLGSLLNSIDLAWTEIQPGLLSSPPFAPGQAIWKIPNEYRVRAPNNVAGADAWHPFSGTNREQQVHSLDDKGRLTSSKSGAEVHGWVGDPDNPSPSEDDNQAAQRAACPQKP